MTLARLLDTTPKLSFEQRAEIADEVLSGRIHPASSAWHV